MISCLKVKRHEANNQKYFIKNGGRLLEELDAFSNGRSNTIRHFSANELLTATNYYGKRQMFWKDVGCRLYEGSIYGLPIIVKKYDSGHPWVSPHKDIAIGSEMSVHKNVLKVLGCCLETKYPIIVYEFAGTKSLPTCISATNDQPLAWKSMLKLAVGLANAITNLHTAFSRPVIHRNISCSNILLDENNVPKLTHFGLCISIPEGQSHDEDDLWECREKLAAPEYCASYITQKVDVLSFGIVLFELLSGRKPTYAILEHYNDNIMDLGRSYLKIFINVVDQRITNEGIEVEQLLDFATLLLRCMLFDVQKRPTMIEVAKELRRIHQSFPSPCKPSPIRFCYFFELKKSCKLLYAWFCKPLIYDKTQPACEIL